MIAVGDRFIPRSGEPSEEIEVTSTNALPRVFVKRVRDGLTWDMNESTIAMQWTAVAPPGAPIAGKTPADWALRDPIPMIQAPADSSGYVKVTLGADAKPRLGDGLRAIADMLDERERLYGPAVATWERIARVVGITTEQALEVMLAMKRERAMFSPENPDHVRDQIGYLAILSAVKWGSK